ncbi:MAG: 30S ribosomal protein S16 [Candidatus Pacebacteria bacterium]|nr:30S ribosomal protein S16 [Candidatus Paceibacterota bacterium]
MLKIKLVRFGKRNQPHYRIVVQEAKTKRDGKYTAALGHYAPAQQPKVLELDLEAYKQWLQKGAQPTETVANLAKRAQSKQPFPPKKKTLSKKAKAKLAAAKQAQDKPAATAKTDKDQPSKKAKAQTEEKAAKKTAKSKAKKTTSA